ncbi:MAG: hypothetical protein Q8M65_03240 [Rhodoglobus sp.]|nr:hypothetical protein [Rhodoglobus sp.]
MPPKNFVSPWVQQKGIVRPRADLGVLATRPAAPDADVMAIAFRRAWDADSAHAAMRSAPRYERFTYAVRHVVRVLHGIAAIGHEQGRSVQIYLGRTAADGNAVASRFRVHSDPAGRAHEFGAVLLRAQTSDVVLWEGRLNRAMEVLSDRGRMKVANRAGDARGPVTPRRSSVVYVTWRFVSAKRVRATTRADVSAVVRALVGGDDDLSRDTAEYAFAGLTEPDDAGMIGLVDRDGRRGPSKSYSLGKRVPTRVCGVASRRR